MDQNQHSRRPHYNRGRRGPDRRGSERRSTPSPEGSPRAGDQVDVEQIMRDIRARIAQRHGIELSTQQIQELAARRLEAILDPRTIDPTLMQQLRRGAGTAPDAPAPAADAGYAFEATTLYESHRGALRFMRRLLNPILKLFFNPNPLVHALHTQARLNREAAAREAERARTQTEWNALHYEILQRLVTEVSRVSVEVQALSLRMEALTARVDFNDRKVRSLDTPSSPPPRPPARNVEQPAPPAPAAATDTAAADAAPADGSQAEATRRRRRRRRGRRGATAGAEAGAATVVVGGSEGLAGPDSADLINGEDGDEDAEESLERATADPGAATGTGATFDAAPSLPTPSPLAPSVPASEHAPTADSVPLGAHQPAEAISPASDPARAAAPETTTSAPPPPTQPAPPPDEPSPRPPESDPGPPDR